MAAGLSASLLSPPRRRVLFLWGSSGSARLPIIAPQSWLQRPQTLMNNPTHRLLKKKFAQKQRRRRKCARRGLGRPIRTCISSLTGAGPQRASGWTLARAHAAAAPALQKPLTKRRKRFRGLRAAPFCAKMPAPATGSLLRLGCHFARLSGTAPRSIRARNPCASTPVFSPKPAHLPSPHRRTFKAYTHAHPRTFHAHSKPHPRN